MKHLLKKQGWALLAGTLSLSLLAGCGSSGSDSGSEEAKTAWDEIKEEGTLTVATSGTLFPTSYREEGTDKLTGFEVEVVREIAERLELEVEFSELGFDEMLTSVQTGQVDLAANDIEATEDRKEKFAFSTPFKFSYGTAIVRKDDLSGIKTLEDLKGKKAAGASTSVYMETARSYGAEEVVYDNATNEVYLRDVAIGRTDVILNDYYLQTLALAAFPELNITIHPDIKYSPSEVSMVMNKDNEELVENVNGAIEEMLEDGTIAEISKEFFNGADATQKIDIEE
ncbi:cystine transport system substrate-binding protein [Planomicrobium koreense]|jgi:cystine transport system substrate-binding protein|uniref:Cystine transport system substrate-binding protein n=1 Tax=Planococcus koreensis TaxID=112331 RepID=A0A7W8CTB4_9BACL|nr:MULTISPECIES: transporter substrate-binding domain-containing protein [Planococcus]MBB5181272.1 cystine transport system substrate-binding protein [Planococcus koreensis]MDN3448846.1 transporter substrate-binding domain-containing protein [Planococcus sp. APC 3906]